MRKLLLVISILVCLSSCKTKADFENERNDSLKASLKKHLISIADKGDSIDSIVLLKVDTLNPKLNMSLESDAWVTYAAKRSKLDSLNVEYVKLSYDKAKAYYSISTSMGANELESARDKTKEWRKKANETLSYYSKASDLDSLSKIHKDSLTNLGYYVNFRVVYSDKSNVQDKFTGWLRFAKNYSIIKTKTPEINTDSYLID